MLAVHGVSIQLGARRLLNEVSFQIATNDRIGLVGRNGAGKTTLTKVLAGLMQPTTGSVSGNTDIGYLVQDTKTVDVDITVIERILSVRGLDKLASKMIKVQDEMASENEAVVMRAMAEYPKIEARFLAAGGFAAQSEAESIASNLGISQEHLKANVNHLSGGQRRRVELARILFSEASVLLLDEPTNHLDADSITWLRDYLKNYNGGLMVISHDNSFMQAIVNKVYYLDATSGDLWQYNMRWKQYLTQRQNDEIRRRKEQQNAAKKAETLIAQAEKMRAKATKAVAAQNMLKRAEKLLNDSQGPEIGNEKVAKLRFPTPQPCGKVPLEAHELSKVYGSQEVFIGVDVAVDRGARIVILGLNGAGKTTLLKILAGQLTPDTGEVTGGTGLKLGYYAQEHETLDSERTVLDNLKHSAPELNETQLRSVLGSFLFSGEDAFKPVKVLSGGEKTRLALALLVVSGANVLLLDEPTNNLDPASRLEILDALDRYEGAVILVSHDLGAVRALRPERVILLPDGDEDYWSSDYEELITLA